jgi:hypothetical protein
MPGEDDLDKLLSRLSPALSPEHYVFVTFDNARYGAHAELEPIASFREREGLTLVLSKAKADESGLAYESEFRCITLNVHSRLDAVGLTAAVSRRLADLGISANVIAGYFHDHIFVPHERAQAALTALQQLSV